LDIYYIYNLTHTHKDLKTMVKIYNKIVWDKDGNIIEEDSYDYTGPLAMCDFGPPPSPPPPPPPPPAPPPPPIYNTTGGFESRSTNLGVARRGRLVRGRGSLVTKRGTALGVESEATGSRRGLLGKIETLINKLGVQ
jgi:hypothetical protein